MADNTPNEPHFLYTDTRHTVIKHGLRPGMKLDLLWVTEVASMDAPETPQEAGLEEVASVMRAAAEYVARAKSVFWLLEMHPDIDDKKAIALDNATSRVQLRITPGLGATVPLLADFLRGCADRLHSLGEVRAMRFSAIVDNTGAPEHNEYATWLNEQPNTQA